MFDSLKEFDTWLFLSLNGAHTSWLDSLMYWISTRTVWVPLYIFLLLQIAKKLNTREIFLFLTLIGLLILTSDQLSVMLFKNNFLRLRPCHNSMLQSQIHLVGNCGGMYGFVSSHATNSFALATMLILLFRKSYPWMMPLMVTWASAVAYSRIYLGVHYPFDVLGGALFGILLASFFSWLFIFFQRKIEKEKNA